MPSDSSVLLTGTDDELRRTQQPNRAISEFFWESDNLRRVGSWGVSMETALSPINPKLKESFKNAVTDFISKGDYSPSVYQHCFSSIANSLRQCPTAANVLSDDPELSWLTDAEYETLLLNVWRNYESDNFSVSRTFTLLLSMQYARRPVQLAQLKIGDFQIATTMAPSALQALERLKQITDEGRRLAHYMETNPTAFYRHADCPYIADDKNLTRDQVAQALGFANRKSSEDFILRHTGKRALTGFTLNSLWQIVLAEHKRPNPHYTKL